MANANLSQAELNKLMLAKIAESGLNAKDAAKLGLKVASAPPAEITLKGAGFAIPYFDLLGKKSKFFRWRFLEPVRDKKGDLVRYSQPAGMPPEPYFSCLFDWKKHLAANKGESRVLFLTEGENKASCGAKLGLPVVGLGGAWNFKSRATDFIPGLDQIEWDKATVYIVYDSDAATNPQVMKAEDELASVLVKLGAHVYIVRLPQLVPGVKTGLDDYLVANGLEEFAKLIGQTEEAWSPHIYRSDLLYRAVEKAERLLAAPEHKIFLRGSGLVRVVEEQEESGTVFRRPRGNAYLSEMNAAHVEMLLSAANCVFAIVKKQDAKKELVPADPKKDWCAQVISRPAGFPEQVPWRRLELVTSTPLILKDGSLVDEPGYHETTRVWFDSQGKKFPAIPTRPTRQQARRALELFSEVFGKFPFASEAAYATVLATILGVLLRHLLPTVPLLGITAPDAGSGKTKIAEAIGAATTGCGLPRLLYDNREEFDKHLPIPLKAADRIILIDNVDGPWVNSARLSAVISTDQLTNFRVLGETRNEAIPNHSVFIATGNHLVISGDLPRRSIMCRLVPNVAAPETRTFNFDPPTRAKAMFPELTMAALTAARYYLQAKCPQPQYAKNVALESGSFTEWNHIVRGLLVHLGFGDPLATQAEVRSENPFLENDIELVRTLHLEFGNRDFSVSKIGRSNETCPSRNSLLGENGKWDANKAGNRLRKLRDRVLDGLKVVSDKHVHGVAIYRVLKIEGEP